MTVWVTVMADDEQQEGTWPLLLILAFLCLLFVGYLLATTTLQLAPEVAGRTPTPTTQLVVNPTVAASPTVAEVRPSTPTVAPEPPERLPSPAVTRVTVTPVPILWILDTPTPVPTPTPARRAIQKG